MELKSFKIFLSLILFYLHGAITSSYASPLLIATNDASEQVVSEGEMSPQHQLAPTAILKGSEGQGSGSEGKLQPKPLNSVNDLLLLLLATAETSNTNASAISSNNSSFSDLISNDTANRNISSVMALLSAWLASRPSVTPTRDNNVREQPFLTFIHNNTASDAVDKNDQRQVLDWLHNIVFGSSGSQQSLLTSQSQLYPDRDDYDDHGDHDHGDDYHGHDEDSSYYSDSGHGHGHSHSHDHGHDEFDYDYDHDHHTKGASSRPGMHPYPLKGIREVQFKQIVD